MEERPARGALRLVLPALLSLYTGRGRAVEAVTEVQDFAGFLRAIRQGGTIRLTGDFALGREDRLGDLPLILQKSVTIEGGGHSLSLPYSGIILGADCAFQQLNIH